MAWYYGIGNVQHHMVVVATSPDLVVVGMDTYKEIASMVDKGCID